MSTLVKIKLNPKLYLRDPEETVLGRKIIKESIVLIDKIGFEQFTFKKLAIGIESTEASVYRYFENKNKLLIYLVSWYWVWLDYQITFSIQNIADSSVKLKNIIRIVSTFGSSENQTELDEASLRRIWIRESNKSYLLMEVDDYNKEGLFREYKSLCKKIAQIVLEINPNHKWSRSLVSTMFETVNHQIFFAEHLPSLTEVKTGDLEPKVEEFIAHLMFSSIHSNQNY